MCILKVQIQIKIQIQTQMQTPIQIHLQIQIQICSKNRLSNVQQIQQIQINQQSHSRISQCAKRRDDIMMIIIKHRLNTQDPDI